MKRHTAGFDAELLATLVERLGGRVHHGEVRGTLVGADGTVATVTVAMVGPRPLDADELIAAALAHAELHLWVAAGGCVEPTTKKLMYSRHSVTCSKAVTSVVVYRVIPDGQRRFHFTCSTHAKRPRFLNVEAVLALPKAKLDELRQRYEREWDAKRKAELELEEAQKK